MQFNALMTSEQKHRRDEQFMKRSHRVADDDNDQDEMQRKFTRVDPNSDLYAALRIVNRSNPAMFNAFSPTTLQNLGYQSDMQDTSRVVAASGHVFRGNMQQLVNGQNPPVALSLGSRLGHQKDAASRFRERTLGQSDPMSPVGTSRPGVIPMTPQNQVRLQ